MLRYGIVLLAVSRRTISSQLAASKAELMEVLPLMNFQADLVLGPSLTKTAFHMHNRKSMDRLVALWTFPQNGILNHECGSLHEISRW